MSEPLPTRRSTRWEKPRISRRMWITCIVVGALVGVLGWIGIRALIAKTELETAQALISQMKAQALDFDIAGATDTLDQIEGHSALAVSMTSDPMWRAFEFIPVLGINFSAVRELAEAANTMISDVATPLIGAVATIDPASLAPKDGAIDIQPFIDAAPAVASANTGVKAAIDSVEAINVTGALGPIVAAKEKVETLLAEVAPLLDTMDTVVPLLGPALGSEGPRVYVVMFQNNAEARALGGTALSFAVIKVDQGKIQLENTLAAGFDNFTAYEFPVIPVPDGTFDVYPGEAFGKFIANATVRPSFITAAQITQEMWIRQFGYSPDAIVSIDPVALGYVLSATDPITLASGDILSGDTLVPLLLNDIYQRFNTGDPREDNRQQDLVYAEAVSATFARLTAGPLNPKVLFAAIAQGFTERRILMWSSHPEEEAALTETGLDGDLPKSDDAVDRVGVYFQENVGSKLNYYLQPAITINSGQCRTDGKQSYRIDVQLGNVLQADQVPGISPSILGNYKVEKLNPGVQRMIVMLYAPPGAQITSATVNGAPVDLPALHDAEYPVGKVTLSIEPGAVGTVSYSFTSATPGVKTVEAQVTPMVRSTELATVPLDCATVPSE